MKVPFWMTSADRSFIKWAKSQGLKPQITPNEDEWRRGQIPAAHHHGERVPLMDLDEAPKRIEADQAADEQQAAAEERAYRDWLDALERWRMRG